MGYFKNLGLAKKATKELSLPPSGEIDGVAMFPLDKAPVEPDIVLIYNTPAQMARLVSGYMYHFGGLVESYTTGFGFSCLAALKPYWTGKPALVHPGRGERILGGTDEIEMCFSCPAKYLPQLLDGLEETHKKRTHYPVQSYILYEPPMIPPMKTLNNKLNSP
jgi:uncharacterized protein (DUF169 family)